MPYGRWITDESNPRVEPPHTVLQPDLGPNSRAVHEKRCHGWYRPIGGEGACADRGQNRNRRTGKGASHAWFIGFAPYDSPGRRIAFAVLVENGQYGGTAAAPIAGDIVAAASQLGLFNGPPPEATQ